MSIHFISGKPGGGKTLYSVRLIVEELVNGSRMVITNVPLNLGALNEYLQKEYPHHTISVIDRVWVLTDEQTAEFWTYRPNGVRIERLSQADWKSGRMPSYAGAKDSGVFYAIDEVHNFFGARQWAETGRDVLFYLSQHRKLGDTVVCITQAIGNVDKQFRSVAQDFTYLRNLSKERYGIFRLPSLFVRKTYTTPATDTSDPMETGTFKLDVRGLASCYDSAAGVGIHGKLADSKERKKGFNLVWGMAGTVLLFCVIAFWAPEAIASFFRTDAERGIRRPGSGAVTNSPPPSSQGHAVTMPPAVRTGPSSVPPVGVSSKTVKMTGAAKFDGRILVILSDGRVLDSRDRRFRAFNPQFVDWAGVRYYASEDF